MIPTSSQVIGNSELLTEQTSYTYQLKTNLGEVKGYIDDISAIKQAIYKILLTEKGKFPIYSENFGIALEDFIGQSIYYAQSEIPTRIINALANDSRIINVSDFSFQKGDEKGSITVKFFVSTIFGDIEIETEVNI